MVTICCCLNVIATIYDTAYEGIMWPKRFNGEHYLLQYKLSGFKPWLVSLDVLCSWVRHLTLKVLLSKLMLVHCMKII